MCLNPFNLCLVSNFPLNLFGKFLTLCPLVTSTETCIYPSSTLAVICLNAFQPLTCSNIPLRMKRKKRISEVNGVKTVCFLPHQEKPGSAFRAYVYQLTSLPHHGSWVVLRLPGADVSGSIWVNLPLSLYCSFSFLSGKEKKRSLHNPWRFRQLQYQQKELK